MKKTTAFALALVILAMLFAAIGCVNVNPGKNPSGSADKDGDDWDLNRFSDIDLNGATVRMMSRAHERHANELTVDDEDEPKDFVLAEIYNRERYVEEKLHVRIENDKVESTDEHGGRGVLPALVLSNDQTYDVYASSYYATSGLAIDGNFSNVYDVRSIDTERGYWSQYFIEKAQIGKNLYFFTGDAAISALRFLFVTFFNKNMVEEYKIDDPYVLVKNGAWTYDAMYDIVKDIYVDLNNDQIADENDFYGLAVNNYLGSDAYTSAFNLTTVAVNGNHQAEVVVNVNKYTKAVEMVYDLFWKTPGVLCGQDPSYLANILAEEHAIFTQSWLYNCESYVMRDMSADYGIIPYPKYDENQADYYSFGHDQITVFGIPVSSVKKEEAGYVLELMSARSRDTVIHQYYEMALKERYARDEQSIAMLDLVRNNFLLDTGWIYCEQTNLAGRLMRTLVEAKSKSFAQYYAKYESVFLDKVNELNEAFEALEIENGG